VSTRVHLFIMHMFHPYPTICDARNPPFRAQRLFNAHPGTTLFVAEISWNSGWTHSLVNLWERTYQDSLNHLPTGKKTPRNSAQSVSTWWEPKCMRNSIFLLFALKKRLNRKEEACTNSSLSKRKPTKPQMCFQVLIHLPRCPPCRDCAEFRFFFPLLANDLSCLDMLVLKIFTDSNKCSWHDFERSNTPWKWT